MTWLLKILASHWREALIAVLICALTLSISLGRKLHVKYQDDKTKWEVKFATQEQSFAFQVAQAKEKEHEAASHYTETVATIQARHAEALKTVKADAWKNYLARYGSGSLGSGMRHPADPAGMRDALPADGVGSSETDRPGALDENRSDFVADCATTTLIAEEWQDWARRNALPISGD